MADFKIAFAGTPEAALPILKNLSNNFEIACVLTKPPVQKGRSNKLVKSPVHQAALDLNLKVVTQNPNNQDCLNYLKSLNLDAVAVVAYGYILGENILKAAKKGWYNLHFSLLPKFRGAAPVQNSILQGVNKTGISVFKIDKNIDTGLLASQKEYIMKGSETSGELLNKLSIIGAEEVFQVFQKIKLNNLKLKKQIGEASKAPKLTKQDSYIDWDNSAEKINCKIRAFNPSPKAKAILQLNDGEKINLFILKAQIIDEKEIKNQIGFLPKRIGCVVNNKKNLFVKTASNFMQLSNLQIESRNIVNSANFINNLKLDNNSRFI
ncbi:MAG: methionyl-tRNA formyltransferase [Bifidobacteriaceae bacterium]|jgi:methionyl-tRNA formyltransferase|nr:methionyl-tRNA formyltransferase [Bifidobacteriaceae bacterium]